MTYKSRLMFHNITGPSIKLSEDKLSACRKNPIEEFDNGWMFSEKYLNENEEFQIQILHLINSHNKSLQFGITLENPADLKQTGLLSQNDIFKNSWMLQDDKFYYRNDDNIITVEEYDINLLLLQEGDLIGIKLNEKRELCFTHNGIPYRTVVEDIPKNVWVFVNLYGKCSFITIIPIESQITRSQREKMIKKLKLITDNVYQNDECEICFHSYCGIEVRLTNNDQVAQRKNPTNEFRNAVVISNKPLITNKIFKLRIEGLINKWNGSIEFGVTIHNPVSFELPATMTNLRSGTLVLSGNSILTNGHGNQLPYSTISLDDLKIGDEIAVMRNNNGDIRFFINQNDLGVAGNIPIEIEIWVVIDLYGRTIKVAIPNNRPKISQLSLENYLDLQIPEIDKLMFNPICGRNVLITQGGYSASRINDQEFNNGVVFTNRPLKIGECWSVKLVRCVDQWAGNLEMGVTTLVPNELEIPSTMTDSNTGYTAMLTSNGLVINGCPLSQSKHPLDIESIHSVLLTGISSLIEDSTLGVQLIESNKLQFSINNTDLGSITLETDKEVYGVIDLYGKAAEVSIHFNEPCNTISLVNHIDNSTSFIVKADDNDMKPTIENLLICNENSEYNNLDSENGINEMLIDADRSFLRLLSSDESFLNESRGVDRQGLCFHQIHGRNVILSNEGRTAYRPSPNNEFKNALVMSSRPISTDELFEICVEKMTDHWSGSLEMGVTLIRPEELNFPGTLSQLDKDCWILSGSCLMNNGITARNDYGLDMDNIHVNSKIGIIRRQTGMLHFLLDGIDMGSAYFDVPIDIYVILDLYGQCSQVSITKKTGINLSSEHDNISTNPHREFTNDTSVENRHDFSMLNELLKVSPTSQKSVLEKTMSAIKKNLSGTPGNTNIPKLAKPNNDRKTITPETKHISEIFTEETSIRSKSFFCESLHGSGITSDGTGKFYTNNQTLNCVIQFKQSLKTNFYYELLFCNDKNNGYNLEPISFGIISDKFTSERYLPDNLMTVKSSSWIISGTRLFMNNTLRSNAFSPTLTRYKNIILLGLYFYDNYNLEVFVDHVSVGKIISEISEKCYLIVNLRGWFNRLVGLGMSSKPINCVSQPSLNLQTSKHFNKYQGDFHLLETEENDLLNENKLIHFDENLDIEEPLIVEIVNELSKLLPVFFIIMHGIDTCKLTEKIVTSNNDIILCVRRKLLSKYPTSSLSNKSILKMDIQNFLIKELSERFSNLSDLENLGNSKFEIARVLRRRIMWNKVVYDDKKSAFIVPNSSLILEESKIRRMNSGGEFGLCILNQELKSKKFNSYQIQLVHNDCNSDILEQKNDSNTSIIGLIVLDNSHFPNTEDVFRFLMNLSCPRLVNNLSNTINQQLELQKFESKAAVLLIDENKIYFNGKKICQSIPISSEDYISFTIVDGELEMSDIILSIKKGETKINHKIFSQKWLQNNDTIKNIYSTKNDYYYVPFVWLKNQSMAIVTTESQEKTLPINEIPHSNQQDWLEKHYHDGLNKESIHSEISHNLVLNKQDRQCFSLLRSVIIKKALALPDIYFHNKLVDCFCNNCNHSLTVGATDSAKEFRLPFGWVKYNIRLKKDEKCNFSHWKLAYLTVSVGMLHRLLSSINPCHILSNCNNSDCPQLAWLKSSNSETFVGKPIVVSPWKPLSGCYLNDDYSIRPCSDGLINCYDLLTNSEIKAKIAFEVRIKPNSYKNLECKIITENQIEIKRIIPKDIESGDSKKLLDCSLVRPVNQKTVWILNGEENNMVISGLLMKI